ncbi:hypothetical protein GCM10018954_077560 [Kutzneria kofuensis]
MVAEHQAGTAHLDLVVHDPDVHSGQRSQPASRPAAARDLAAGLRAPVTVHSGTPNVSRTADRAAGVQGAPDDSNSLGA